MIGEAEKTGITSEQDVVDLVDEIRGEIWGRQHAGNA